MDISAVFQQILDNRHVLTQYRDVYKRELVWKVIEKVFGIGFNNSPRRAIRSFLGHFDAAVESCSIHMSSFDRIDVANIHCP
jgi:hypothetical protein